VTPGEALKSIVATYRGSLLLAQPSGIDYEAAADRVSKGSGGHGTHGERGRALDFGDDLPLSVEMERALVRFATVWGRRLEAAQSGAPAFTVKGSRHNPAKRQEDAAILAHVGDPTEAAYLYGRTTEGVRKLRLRRGHDPETGLRIRRDTLDDATRNLDPGDPDDAALAATVRERLARPITAPGRVQHETFIESAPTTTEDLA
jgi:hypothetical protein